MRIDMVPIEKVTPYLRNPRDNRKAISKVQASIKEFNWRQPIVVDKEYVIVCGHARYAAAQNLGHTEVPVHVAENLTPAQLQAYRIMDNRSHEDSMWDDELLAVELRELRDSSLDLMLTGFETAELDALILDSEEKADEKAIPATPAVPLTQPGDIWQLGKHRVICGDSQDSETYAHLVGLNKVDMIFTDPPYNVDYHSKAGSIANDNLSDAAFRQLLNDAFKHMANALKEGGAAYVCYSERETLNFHQAFRDAGLQQASCLVWRKNHFVLGRQDYHAQHEPILYGWKPGKARVWHGGRKRATVMEFGAVLPFARIDADSYQITVGNHAFVVSGKDIQIEMLETSIIECDKPRRNDLHPTMKPIELIERLIRNSSAFDDVVLDPFGGSGSTLIAAEKTGRTAMLIELDPRFVDVIVRRWMELTGKAATHAKSGEPFQQEGRSHE